MERYDRTRLERKMASAGKKKSVLFICLGNICRSPIAEAVFLDLLKKQGKKDEWHVDSAAIGDYHVGGPPDRRTMRTLKKFNITSYNHTVRQITGQDFDDYDYIFGMDQQNIEDLEDIQPSEKCKAQIKKLGEYDPQKVLTIRDPYYDSGIESFETVYEQCVRCCEGFLLAVEEGKT